MKGRRGWGKLGADQLFGFELPSNLRHGWASLLPPEYFKFREECRLPKTPVHYRPRPGKYERNEFTGEVRPVQNIPLAMKFPRESHQGIWGGEGIVKGFTKPKPLKQRCPHLWIPQLKKTVVHSEILNKFMSVVVTERTIELIHQHYGFDNYILETKANNLQSLLAMSIKREMLKAIHDGCPALQDEPEKQQEILAKYKKFGDQYTPTEVEWYGLSHFEAVNKVKREKEAEMQAKIGPEKHVLRQKLIEDLKASGLEKVEQVHRTEDGELYEQPKVRMSWVSKLNPFGSKK